MATPEPRAEPAPRRLRPTDERVVVVRARTALAGVGIVLGVGAVVWFVLLAQAALTLIAVAMFIALALNPAVEFFQRHGATRGVAVATVYVIAVAVFALLALVFVPPLVTQIGDFVRSLPALVQDLTKGRGPLGLLERKYHVVEQVRKATAQGGTSSLTGAAVPVLGVAKGIATTLGGLIIIGFLTLFMLLEGPEWRAKLIDLVPDRHRPAAERVGSGVYRSVGGFVTGNLLASFIAGVFATILLLILGVPYAIPLGLFTAIIEFVPYLGPALVTVLLSLVTVTQSTVHALIVLALMTVYHLIEGHSLRPLIYGRALQLSALAILIAILIGTEVAGILGALAAIPIAGSIQVVISELLGQRDERRVDRAETVEA